MVGVTTSDAASAATGEVAVTPLAAREIEAGTFKTADSGRRLELSGADNSLTGYDDDGAVVGQVDYSTGGLFSSSQWNMRGPENADGEAAYTYFASSAAQIGHTYGMWLGMQRSLSGIVELVLARDDEGTVRISKEAADGTAQSSVLMGATNISLTPGRGGGNLLQVDADANATPGIWSSDKGKGSGHFYADAAYCVNRGGEYRVHRALDHLGPSSRRLKRDITDLPPSAGLASRARPRQFEWTDDPGSYRYGFVADELPDDLVVRDEENGDELLSALSLVAALCKDVQTLSARVDELEGK